MDKKKIDRYITELNMDGLRGRMLRKPATGSNKQEILLIYGHHSSLERMYSFADALSDYGSVTIPDLPGFGGMDSFYSIGEKPSIDQLGDYLAAFVKMKYKRKKVILVGFSLSVPIIINMLQRYPELTSRVTYILSVVGFVHKEDFAMPDRYQRALKALSWVGSTKVVSFIVSKLILRPFVIKSAYRLVASRHQKMKSDGQISINELLDFEVELWTINDVRTWFYTMGEMFRLDLCHTRVDVPIHHVSPDSDAYLDDAVVQQHMQIIFKNFKSYKTKMLDHAPSVVADKKEILPLFPPKVRKLLANR